MVSKEQQFAQNFPDDSLASGAIEPDDWEDEKQDINDWQDEPVVNTKQPVSDNITRAESLARGAYDTATSGFGDEIQAIGATPVRVIANDITGQHERPSLEDIQGKNPIEVMQMGLKPVAKDYEDSLQMVRNREKQAQQQNPINYGIGQVAGAIGTGIKISGTEAAASVGNAIDRGLLSSTSKGGKLANSAAKIGASGLAGAASSGLYKYGSGEGENRSEGTGEAALLGGLVGGAAPILASTIKSGVQGTKNIIKGVNARNGEELVDIGSGLKKGAVAIKDEADLKSVILSPNKTTELASNIDKALSDVELIPEYTPKTIGVINRIKERIEKGELNLNQLDQYRRMLGNTSGEDSAAASAVRKAIGNTLDSVKSADDLVSGSPKSIELLNQFRKDYTQASKFSDIADIIKKSDGDRGKIKSSLNRFLNNSDNTRGWSDEEINALTVAAKSNTSEHFLNALGRFGFDKNNIAFPTLTGFGSLVNSSVALPAITAGTAARASSKYIARGKAEELLRIIEQGGKPSVKEINSLPVKDAKLVLDKLKSGAKYATPTLVANK